MFSKVQFVSALCACTVALAAAVPYKRDPANSFMLTDVASKTLCPMRVEVNRNENRIPRYIKFITCDVQESPSAEPQHCTYHPDGNTVRSCVQLEDFAPVQYLEDDGSFTNSTLKVPVGCACMTLSSVDAVEVQS